MQGNDATIEQLKAAAHYAEQARMAMEDELKELTRAMWEPAVAEMLGFGSAVISPYARIADFLRWMAAERSGKKSSIAEANRRTQAGLELPTV